MPSGEWRAHIDRHADGRRRHHPSPHGSSLAPEFCEAYFRSVSTTLPVLLTSTLAGYARATISRMSTTMARSVRRTAAVRAFRCSIWCRDRFQPAGERGPDYEHPSRARLGLWTARSIRAHTATWRSSTRHFAWAQMSTTLHTRPGRPAHLQRQELWHARTPRRVAARLTFDHGPCFVARPFS